MNIDEILVYLTVAAASAAVAMMVIGGWNRPFFRSKHKATHAIDSRYLAPMWGFKRRRRAF